MYMYIYFIALKCFPENMEKVNRHQIFQNHQLLNNIAWVSLPLKSCKNIKKQYKVAMQRTNIYIQWVAWLQKWAKTYNLYSKRQQLNNCVQGSHLKLIRIIHLELYSMYTCRCCTWGNDLDLLLYYKFVQGTKSVVHWNISLWITPNHQHPGINH